MTITLKDLEAEIRGYYPEADLTAIRKASGFSETAHAGQKRASGEPYLYHPLEVASILARLHMDIPSIVAAILHDTVEDTNVSLEALEKEFGTEIRELVDGVTKLSKISFKNIHEKQAENFRKMVVAMGEDIRVILIKLADRLHNMRTLKYLSPAKQARIAQETLDIYAPIANRLGIAWMKIELEDLSMRWLKPEVYQKMSKQIAKNQTEREQYIERMQRIIRNQLEENGIKVMEVTGRPKHFYSVYRKMETRNLDFDQIFDLIAFRIIVKTIPECYEVLGVVHSAWKPIPGRFKDFIAMPKANSYQSLHTSIIGPGGERVEIQIRTEEMHRIAEEGIAAHWEYKEGNLAKKDVERFTWVRQLLEWQRELKDPSEFLETMKVDLFPGDVYVFTPKGDVIELPRGSTPVDFAYAIHTGVGHRCVGAKVNGRMVPLRYRLKSGDAVEVITSSTEKPNKEWLVFVASSKAKARIRSFIKTEERARGLSLGQSICEKLFRRHNLSFSEYHDSEALAKIAKELGHKTIPGLLVAVGYGFVQPRQIIQRLFPQQEIKVAEPEQTELQKIFKAAAKKSEAKWAIKIKGEEDVLVRFARCCHPLPGDAIIGFVTRGRGVSVHRANCVKMLSGDAERKMDVEWDIEKTKEVHHHIKVKVVCIDESGLLVKMSNVFTSAGINITQAQIRTTRDKKAISIFEVDVFDLEQLQRVIKDMEAIEGVISVERI